MTTMPDEKVCGSTSPGPHAHTCELPAGHDGRHRATAPVTFTEPTVDILDELREYEPDVDEKYVIDRAIAEIVRLRAALAE